MTMYEMNFSLLVEDTLKNIVLPEYRQIIVEVRLCIKHRVKHNSKLGHFFVCDEVLLMFSLAPYGGVSGAGEKSRTGVSGEGGS